MEACVLNQPLQQTINNNTIEIPSTHLSIQDEPLTTKTTLKRSGTSLSDLIPKAAAALKTQQLLRQQQQQTSSFQDPTLPTPTTTFGRALTKVKLQIQTKRLKERYLSHEWIRLALSLPVDTSHINLHHYYYQKEEKSSIPVTIKETKGENEEEEQDIVKNNIEEEKHNPSSFIKNETPMSPPFTTISSLSTTTTTTTTTTSTTATITNTSTSCQNDHPILHSMVSPPSSPKPAFINDHHDSVEANKNGQNHDQTILSPTISTELSLLKEEEKQEKGKKNQHYDNSSNNNNNNNKKNGTYYYHCNIVIPKVPTSRTEEIVTWYEWKLNKTKFSIDEIESKVDQLRKVKLQDKLA